MIWFRHIHHASIFRLGPLQFQRFEMVYLDEEGCGQAYMTLHRSKSTCPRNPVINLHIPKDANLSPATVADALDQAMAFFPQVFRNTAQRHFYATLGCCIPDFRRFCRRKVTFAVCRPVSDHWTGQDPPESIRRIYGKRFPRKELSSRYAAPASSPGPVLLSWGSLGILEIPPHRHPRWPNHHKLSTAAQFPKGVGVLVR